MWAALAHQRARSVGSRRLDAQGPDLRAPTARGAPLLVSAREGLEIEPGSVPRASASRQAAPTTWAPSTSLARNTSPAEQVTVAPPSPHTSRTPGGVYAADIRNFSPAVAGFPERVYVPNTDDGTVDVIDPSTFRIVDVLDVGGTPHHVTPSWNLRHLFVDNPSSDRLTEIDPATGTVIRSIAVSSPYNLYFTPDGTKAIVVAEYDRFIEFRDPHTWRLIKRVSIPWPGVDHMDFSANGRYFLISCEYSGVIARVSAVSMHVTRITNVGGLPIDVKLSPDGRVFYVANQGLGGVSVIDPTTMRQVAFIPTGDGAHGFAVSRDAKYLYVSNRLAHTISVISFRTRRVVATWTVGGSPDMLQVSPDGTQLWASNRFGNTVSVISARTGRLIHTIVVGAAPHGLAYFPQPGRYSLGHNGVYR
jgi:YVTN family beta-propeller protein